MRSELTRAVVVTSGPSSTYPQRAYRNPTDELVKWLDFKHGKNWSIWEFRAEGTGYPDSEVYGRIHHYPWPDHHPPPFALIPNIMASMRNWLKEAENKKVKRVVVVHCKAGKGRSGTIACSYLVSQEGWAKEDALARFTARRMRPGFGPGVSIPSQLRWVNYVHTWSKTGKVYVERPVEIVEVHAWGLREGVKVSVGGFIEEGRKIKTLHIFQKEERLVVDGDTSPSSDSLKSTLTSASGSLNLSPRPTPKFNPSPIKHTVTDGTPIIDSSSQDLIPASDLERVGSEVGGKAVIFRPLTRVLIPTSDVCVDLERRHRAPYGWTMVTAVAHVWFNAFFEGLPPPSSMQDNAAAHRSDRGVFEITWDKMDGLKGSSKKGTRALDRLAVVWRAVEPENDRAAAEEGVPIAKVITQPKPGEAVPETQAADWKGGDADDDKKEDKTLGMRVQSPASKDVSRASTVKGVKLGSEGEGEGGDKGDGRKGGKDYEEEIAKVKTHGMGVEGERRSE